MGVRCDDGSEHDQPCRPAQEVRGPPRRGRCPCRRVRACRSDPRPVKLNLPLGFHNCLATDLLWLVLTILAILGLIPNVMSLAQGSRLRGHVRRGMRLAFGGFLPPAVVILPVRGIDPGFDENVRAILRQSYPNYRLLVVSDDSAGPAADKLRTVAGEGPRRPVFVVGGGARH